MVSLEGGELIFGNRRALEVLPYQALPFLVGFFATVLWRRVGLTRLYGLFAFKPRHLLSV